MVEDARNPISDTLALFLIEYMGVDPSYVGHIVSDGVRYAYVVDDKVVREMLEPQLNLYCRTLIRKAIREHIDALEVWPLGKEDDV